MKKIIRIARVELSNLFYSPIAWLLLGIFLVQCGVTFSEALGNFLQRQRMGSLFTAPPESATLKILVDPYTGLFPLIVAKLYFYLPLITMGLISREVSSGSIRLLHSSPITTAQIVLGKFLAMIYYNIMLVAVLAIFTTVACWVIPNVETGIVLTGLLAFFLLLCTYAAIGLFMSCLTSYQVVAALSTLAFFAFLHYVGTVWQEIDFVRDLTHFLSLGNRSKDLFDGMLTSRDVIYFILITLMFLGFSMLRLKSEQEYKPFGIRALRYITIIAVVLGLGYLTSRPSMVAYFDVTKQKVNTITDATQALLASTGDEKLEVKAYVNLLDMRYFDGQPKSRNNYLRIWEKYTRFKDIDYSFYYYYDTSRYTSSLMERNYAGKDVKQVAEDFVKIHKTSIDRFNTPEDARKQPVLTGEDGKMIMELKYKGKTTALRMYDDREKWPSEAQFTAALKRLMTPASIQRVGFLTGQYQRDAYKGGDRNYILFSSHKPARNALINNGFDIVTIDEGADIPEDLAVLIIGDPKSEFSEDRLAKLRRYIAAGGNLLITTEPNKQVIMQPLLKELGVEVQAGTIVSRNGNEVPTMIPTSITQHAANMSKGISYLYNTRQQLVFNEAAALTFKQDDSTGFSSASLANTTGPAQWLRTGKLVTDSALVQFDEIPGDIAGTFSPILALERQINGREQRIIVSGDGDFIGNLTLQKFQQAHTPFYMGMFKWFSSGGFPIELSAKPILDDKVDLTEEGLNMFKIVFLWVLPAILIAFGTILLLRRKRK